MIHGEALAELRRLPENSVDAICCDPPAGISFMSKNWDRDKGGREQWIAWLSEIMAEVLRVLKPGGHAFIWALPRTSHWTACALEDAGFEIREKFYHVHAQGFPKALDISQVIDRMAGKEREVIGLNQYASRRPNPMNGTTYGFNSSHYAISANLAITKPATPEAEQWSGWKSATKPAVEEWILCRKPLSEPTIAQNVVKWGTGALNIAACRIGTASDMNPRDFDDSRRTSPKFSGIMNNGKEGQYRTKTGIVPNGRFPSNLLLSHSMFCTHDQCSEDCPIWQMDQQSGVLVTHGGGHRSAKGFWQEDGIYNGPTLEKGDSGGASRFFQQFWPDELDEVFLYCPKASKADRTSGGTVDNIHPTAKNTKLMQYLVRLTTPPSGTVLDCFAGSGSTLVACIREGFQYIGIEQDEQYIAIAQARIAHEEAQ